MLHARIFSDSVSFVDISRFRMEGVRVSVTPGWEYQPCDIAIMYGLANPKRRSKQGLLRNAIHREHKGPIVVIESSLIGRSFKRRLPPWIAALRRRPLRPRQVHPYYRVAVGGALGDDADFGADDSPPDRWERMKHEFGIALKPYRTAGDHIVLVGQVPMDASLRGVDVNGWLRETASAIHSISARPILIRLHPSTRWRYQEQVRNAFAETPGVTVTAGERALAEDLAGAWTCVTLSSGAAIDALIEGIPPICLSPASLAYNICSRDMTEVECPKLPEREQFMRNLAYSQWSLAEMADGTVWQHIQPVVYRQLNRVERQDPPASADAASSSEKTYGQRPRTPILRRLLDCVGPRHRLHSQIRRGDERQWQASLARWNAVARAMPDHSWALAGQAKALFHLRRYAEARIAFDRLRQLRPDLVFAHEAAARAAEKIGDWRAAEAAWAEAEQLAPDRLVSLRGRAKALLRLQRDDQAEAMFDRLGRIYPAEAVGFRGLVQIAMRRRDWARAIELFDLVWTRFRDAEALRQKVSLLVRLQRLDEARDVVDSLASSGAPTLPYLLAAVRLLEHHHDWAAVHTLLKDHGRLVEENWLLTFSHATALGKLGRTDEALALIERCSTANSSMCANLKARLLIEARRYEDARRCLQQIFEGSDLGTIPPELVAPVTDAAWALGGMTLANTVLDRIAAEAPGDKSGEILRLMASFQRNKVASLTGLFADSPYVVETDRDIERRVSQQLASLPDADPALGPVREISHLYMQLRSTHPGFRPNPSTSLSDALEVAARIAEAQERKRPLSLIRLGDGEGNLLPYRAGLEMFSQSDRTEVQHTWWGNDAPVDGESDLLRELLLQAVGSADIVGIPDLDRVVRTMLNHPVRATHDGSRNADGGRNARGLLASIDAAAAAHGSGQAASILTSCHIHQSMSFWGLWDLLLPRLRQLSLITCHAELPKVLADRHGVDIANAYLVPPERKYAGAFKDTHDARHYPDTFDALRARLEQAGEGQVFLVAAGMLGKVYCMWIKRAGGIAIDIGSAADFWCGFQTRGLADLALYKGPPGIEERVRQVLSAHSSYRVLVEPRDRNAAVTGF